MELDLTELPTDPIDACLAACTWLIDGRYRQSVRGRLDSSGKFSDQLRGKFERALQVVRISGKRTGAFRDISRHIDLARSHLNELNEEGAKTEISEIFFIVQSQKLDAHFSSSPDIADQATFTLDTEEVETILEKTSEMRSIVSASEVFDDAHKRRLLDRISHVEFEIYKENGRLDTILGGLVDFGDALGKFGKKVKPLVDRMSEIRKITQAKSKSYDGLPPPEEVKKLPPPEDDAEGE